MSTRNGATLRPARPEDLPQVLALLQSAKLPLDGVAEGFDRYVVATADTAIVGVAGLELYDSDGLLRSVAVAEDWRGRALGSALTEAVVALARSTGVRDLYLLTDTAAAFFPRHGFQAIARNDVAPGIKRSVEYAELCAVSSTVMVRPILNDGVSA